MQVRALVGCDFSSRPTRRKPIVLAHGLLQDGRVRLTTLQRIDSLQGFAQWLSQVPEWIGVFDFPFGLPRELLEQLGWPLQW